MAEKAFKVGIKEQKGYIYFIDRDGDVSRLNYEKARRITDHINDFYYALTSEGVALEALGNMRSNLEKAIHKAATQKIIKLGIKRQKGYIYFIDDDGDVSRRKLSKKARRYG